MVYDANEVAKLVVKKGMEEGRPVTNLKLQKILYFMWIDWYNQRKEALFDNRIEAWHYGPVIPDVYFRYRIFVADPIRKDEDCSVSELDAESMIKLIRKYNSKTAGALVDDSHAPGTPWDRVDGDKVPGTEITKDLMIDEANRQSRIHLRRD